MRKIAMLIMAIAGLGLLAQNARAANPAEVEVWVMISNLSVNISSATWYNYGPTVAGTTPVQGTSFVVQNNGNIAETFQLRVVPTSNALVGGGGLWTLVSGAPAGEQVRLCALFTAGPPAVGDFTPGTDALTTALVSSGAIDASPFAFTDFATQGGNAVGVGASRNLWTRLDTSATTTQYTNKFIRLEVNAI